MIYGVGTDICQISRVDKVFQRYPEGFVKRILTAAEQQVWHSRQNKNYQRGIHYLAAQFSAKEAFSKAIGLGLHSPMSWQNIAVLRAKSGKPEVVLFNQLLVWFKQRNLVAQISISDEKDYVVSFAVTEQLS